MKLLTQEKRYITVEYQQLMEKIRREGFPNRHRMKK